MYYLFEEIDMLKTPLECFIYDASCCPFPVRPHWHYFAEVIFMLEGSAEMRTDSKSIIAEEGSLVFFHPKTVHSIFAAGGGALRYAVMKFDISVFTMTSAYAPKLRSIFRQAELAGADIYFPPEAAAQMDCRRIFSECVRELEEYRYGFDLIIRADIYSLLAMIVRRWRDDGLKINTRGTSDEETAGIDGAAEYIDSRMNENIKVSEIAEYCKMSYSCFAKKFRSLYGMTCKEYIERMRIHKAEELLLFTDHDLSFISQETGFSDCSHLIKSFKRIKGTTPKQFRKEQLSVSEGGHRHSHINTQP